MLYTKILVPYDTSASAGNALREAEKIVAAQPDAELIVLRILVGPQKPLTYSETIFASPDLLADADMSLEMYRERGRNAHRDLTARVHGILGDTAHPLDVKVRYAASPAQGIIEAADEVGADLIVMGCRGLSGIRSALGSVSNAVLRACTVPVLITK